MTTGGGTTQTPGPHRRCHQAKLGEADTNRRPTATTATITDFFISTLVSLDASAVDLIRALTRVDEGSHRRVYLD